MELDLQLQCPCCFRPGTPFCDECEPEDAARRLTGLRALIKAHGLDAYIVTSVDAHCSEYIATADERRSYLTGFSGSLGTAVVTATQALLWVDSRYFIQAEAQIKGTEWVMMKMSTPGSVDLEDWVPANLPAGAVVGVDPALLNVETAEEWRKRWSPKVVLKGVRDNLVDAIWLSRPEDPCNPVVIHPQEYAGESVSSKLSRLRSELEEQEQEAIILSALDQVAWLFNLRGSDIACNPVFFSYAVVTKTQAVLYLRVVEEGRPGLDDAVSSHLAAASVETRPYSQFFSEARSLLAGKRVLLEPNSSSLAVMELVEPELLCRAKSPVDDFKDAKNEVEIAGLRRASKRDSLAICEFMARLEARLSDPSAEPLSEVDADELIGALRKKQPLCVGDSFPTISSVGSNAAIVHYHAQRGSCKVLAKEEIYLVDTGGQYLDGTTDITRTVHFGTPSDEQRCLFTRVVQGHIALAKAVFPVGCPGLVLDALTRQPLWRHGLDYGHGTGHGMGAYLNVHEGSALIGGGNRPGKAIQRSEAAKRRFLSPLQEGHYLSDEPGCYKAGEFGIRIESDLVVAPAKTDYDVGGRKWLCFDYLTLVPICRELLNVSLLSADEIRWLDDYHRRIWEELEEELTKAEGVDARDWLRRATLPLIGDDAAAPS